MEREQFGKFIFDERNRQGLTQKELAIKAGVSRQRVSEIESNRYNYGVDILIACLKALDFELEAMPTNDEEKETITNEDKKIEKREFQDIPEKEDDGDW